MNQALSLLTLVFICIPNGKAEEIPTDRYSSQDCCAIQLEGNTMSGIYMIYPFEQNSSLGVEAYCDLETNGGGWTVIQRREEMTGPVERFYRGWNSYISGFGTLNYSHWLGLDNIAALTSGMDQELRIDLYDREKTHYYASYKEFQVDDGSFMYRLHVRNYYNGTAGDNFSLYSHGMSFTTKDRDNDYDTRNCATARKSAGWYINCDGPNLNGLYILKGIDQADGLSWGQIRGMRPELLKLEMKVRNHNFPNGCLNTEPDSDSDSK